MEWALIQIREKILEEISQEIICVQCETNKYCIAGSLCRLRSQGSTDIWIYYNKNVFAYKYI